MTDLLSRHLKTIVRIALGSVFIYAGTLKILAPAEFAGSIAAYRILPYFWNYAAAAVLPWIEVICGLLLVAGLRQRSAAFFIACLNLLFIAAIAAAMFRGLDIGCGCFGGGDEKTSPTVALLRDFAFLAASFWLLRPTPNHPAS